MGVRRSRRGPWPPPGITGTNGKTTTSYLLDAALRAGGHTTGVIGTVATHIGDEVIPATRTTPEAPDLHALLAVMRERGASAVTMEVSSHALELGRVDGVLFDLAVFTNLSQDHLDFHGDMESYFAAKAAAVHRRSARPRASSASTTSGAVAWPPRRPSRSRPTRWGRQRTGRSRDVAHGDLGTTSYVAHGPGVEVPARVGLPGLFNVANALAALAAAVHHGVDADVAAAAIGDCAGVPGRMERVRRGRSSWSSWTTPTPRMPSDGRSPQPGRR